MSNVKFDVFRTCSHCSFFLCHFTHFNTFTIISPIAIQKRTPNTKLKSNIQLNFICVSKIYNIGPMFLLMLLEIYGGLNVPPPTLSTPSLQLTIIVWMSHIPRNVYIPYIVLFSWSLRQYYWFPVSCKSITWVSKPTATPLEVILVFPLTDKTCYFHRNIIQFSLVIVLFPAFRPIK